MGGCTPKAFTLLPSLYNYRVAPRQSHTLGCTPTFRVAHLTHIRTCFQGCCYAFRVTHPMHLRIYAITISYLPSSPLQNPQPLHCLLRGEDTSSKPLSPSKCGCNHTSSPSVHSRCCCCCCCCCCSPDASRPRSLFPELAPAPQLFATTCLVRNDMQLVATTCICFF